MRTKFCIRIVDHKCSSTWPHSEFWRKCTEVGIPISFVAKAVSLQNNQLHPVSKRPFIWEAELKHRFWPAFWEKMARWEPTGAACTLSHLRGHADGAETVGENGWVIMFEHDIELATNAFLELLWLVRFLMSGTAAAQRLYYVALVSSTDRQDHVAAIIEQAKREPPTRSNNWHFQVLEHPRERKGTHNEYETLRNCGTATRGYAVRTDFIAHLDNTSIWQWADVWMHAEACNYGNQQEMRGSGTGTGLLFPSMGVHPVDRSSATRGSDRVRSLAVCPEQTYRPYITVALDKGWGYCNRILTMCCVMVWAHTQGWGVHILWAQNEACQASLPETAHVPPKCSNLPGLAFVAIHHDRGHFGPYTSSTMQQNKGNFRFQTTPKLFLETMKQFMRGKPNPNPNWNEETSMEVFREAWHVLQPKPDLVADVTEWMAQWAPDQIHCAIHVRRGDFKATRLTDARRHGNAQAAEMRRLFEVADEQVEEPHVVEHMKCGQGLGLGTHMERVGYNTKHWDADKRTMGFRRPSGSCLLWTTTWCTS